jgi:ribosomal protein S18 acetylase RimI-like enzyme
MTEPDFRLEALGDHDRSAFSSSVVRLDRYLREQASQDVRRRVANCFVAVEVSSGRIAAYDTLAATGISLTDFPPARAKQLPRYPVVPAALIGRLAVDIGFRDRGLGHAMLGDAVRRAARSEAAIFAVLVDAKDDSAASFYRKHGFTPLVDRPHNLSLAITQAMKQFL